MQQRITIIGGAYGSGKTEFAIAFAANKARLSHVPTGLIDLDIVNPYFRSRDLAAELETRGIAVVSTAPGLENADLPALSPQIYTFLQDQTCQVVFDVGGDPVGARALGRFNPYFQKEAYDFWAVVNPFRPDTRTSEEAAELIAGLESASRLKVNGLVANINLGPQTTREIWEQGQPFIRQLADRLALPVVYQMVEADFHATVLQGSDDALFFPVQLHMLPPWLKA